MRRAWSKSKSITLALIATMLLGVLDYVTGNDLVISAFYLVPVCWACWGAGRAAGVTVAFASAAAWLVSDVMVGVHYTHFGIVYWNTLMLFVFFVVIVLLQSAYQAAHERMEETVAERTTALRGEIVERQTAEAARWQLLRQLAEAQEGERGRLARELHEQFGQELTALKLGLQMMAEEDPNSSDARRRMIQLTALAEKLIQEVHRLAWELRPAALDDFGLEAALQRYTDEWAEQSGVRIDVHTTGLETLRLPGECETTLYRIIQEALTNVARHAQARHVSVLLERKRGHVSLIVEDDGRGFDTEEALKARSANGKLGLLGMQERVMLNGGMVEIESAPASGTTILVRIPLEHAVAKESA